MDGNSVGVTGANADARVGAAAGYANWSISKVGAAFSSVPGIGM